MGSNICFRGLYPLPDEIAKPRQAPSIEFSHKPLTYCYLSKPSANERSDMRTDPAANRLVARGRNPPRRLRITAARARPTQRLPCSPNCEIAHRQPIRFGCKSPMLARRRRQLCCWLLFFLFGVSSCAVSIARPLRCGRSAFFSPP
jgi:hypothetical protein